MQQPLIIEHTGPQRMLLREVPQSEWPTRRLERYGSKALSNAELLGAIVKTPDAISLAHELLGKFGSLQDVAKASLADLCTIAGIGDVKAAQIHAAFELGRRLVIESPDTKPQIQSPAGAANLILVDMGLLDQEELWVLVLNTKNHVLEIDKVYKGSVNTSLIRVSEIFRTAIKRNAAAIIVAHCHPSGDPTPSPEDVRVTSQLVDAGKLLDIDVLDHLIIGHQRFVSLKEQGKGFD